MDQLQTVSIIITGKVQGVFFRQSSQALAKSLGITGYVENLDSGQVHIIATGLKEILEELTSWCQQGPSKATVSHVEVTNLPIQHFSNFSIHR
jgi:acylphosphatase